MIQPLSLLMPELVKKRNAQETVFFYDIISHPYQ